MAQKPNYSIIRDDPRLRETLEKRTLIIRAIREFFWSMDFRETDTPILVNLPGMEPYLDVFKTRFEPMKGGGEERDMYLITSPEYAMKKLLVAGFSKIFQITRSFRNKETGGALHNPEFTMLEWYRANSDYREIMSDTEALIRYLCEKLFQKNDFIFQGKTIDVARDFERLRVIEAFEKYAGISREVFEDTERLIEAAQKKGYKAENYDDAFFLIFLNEIESKLGMGRPTILYEYPVSMAALSKVCPANPKYAERFEIYISGIELCNAFSELTDAKEQGRRLEEERAQRATMGKPLYDVDRGFLDALAMGMPESGGIALGVDRLIMLLLDQNSIENVIFFPFRDL
ncbi:MAG: EF-P lysine aminoacylase EpmA [Candidatus Peregrinibacteria bacterium]|nr:EF-P lysine aminoacylase EpmA [Candidatus Peregrinibacteria bacterium]